MTRAVSAWFELHREIRLEELALRDTFGRSLHPEVFRPEIAGALKAAWLGTRKAGHVVHQTIVAAERPANVVQLAGARSRRASGRSVGRRGGV